jgi:hypothetical protein
MPLIAQRTDVLSADTAVLHSRSNGMAVCTTRHRFPLSIGPLSVCLVLLHFDVHHFMITEYFGRIGLEILRDLNGNRLCPGVRVAPGPAQRQPAADGDE